MMSIFSPAPHIERLPEGQIDSTYKRLRKEVFAGTFIGYATFYLIRQNFSLAVPYMIAEYGYTKADLGIVMTLLSVAYGVSKFVMGNASDRSNPKYLVTSHERFLQRLYRYLATDEADGNTQRSYLIDFDGYLGA